MQELLWLLEAELQLFEPPPEAAPDHAPFGVGELAAQLAAGGGDALPGQEAPSPLLSAHPRQGPVAVVGQDLAQNGVEDFEVQRRLLHGSVRGVASRGDG